MEKIIFSAKQVNGIKKRIPFRQNFSLKHIDFELPAGYIMGIIGKNGAGKTTFFDYIMKEKKQYVGKFLLDGVDIHKNHWQTLDQIGFVSEDNHFMELRTALENAKMLGRFYSFFDMELFHETMDICNLSTKKMVGKMSRGEQMKFQLSFAVAHKPKLYLLDEVTAGMDPIYRMDFYKQLHHLLLNEECSIIMSTHIQEEIDKQMDYIGLLENGNFISFKEKELV